MKRVVAGQVCGKQSVPWTTRAASGLASIMFSDAGGGVLRKGRAGLRSSGKSSCTCPAVRAVDHMRSIRFGVNRVL